MNSNQKQIIEALLDASMSPEDAKQALSDYIALRTRTDQPKTEARTPIDTPVLLSTVDLRKEYKRGRQKIPVLNGVSLSIHEGEFIAVTGASGSGKSTLLQLLGGLDKPSGGEVRYGNVSLAKLSDKKLSIFRRQTIGFVFQFFYLQPFLKVSKNLEVANMFARKPRKGRKDRVLALSEKVGLSDRIEHLPKELSGGQMQRAAIARALMNQPKIILADEPTGNLDSSNSKAIVDLFEAIRDELGTTIVIVTHDPTIAARADREIAVKDGLLVWWIKLTRIFWPARS